MSKTTQTGYDRILAAAERGQRYAQWKMGNFEYEHGDFKRAANWYAQAANNQLALGERALAKMFQGGVGIPADLYPATLLFERAGLQGDKESLAEAGLAFLYNKGVDRDRAEGIRYLKMVQNMGWHSSLADLVFAEAMGIVIPESRGEAVERLFGAAEGGSIAACFALGVWWRNGFTGSCNHEVAFHYLSRASDAGHMAAKLCVGMALIEGAGVEQNIKQGMQLIVEAAKAGEPAAMLI